jgi:hypothetical protein
MDGSLEQELEWKSTSERKWLKHAATSEYSPSGHDGLLLLRVQDAKSPRWICWQMLRVKSDESKCASTQSRKILRLKESALVQRES